MASEISKSSGKELKWKEVQGQKLNSLQSLSALLPDYLTKGREKSYIPKKNITKSKESKDSRPGYKPFKPYIEKPNLDAAGNYGKLIYNRPKS